LPVKDIPQAAGPTAAQAGTGGTGGSRTANV
jgi:hypothetical protein